MQATNSRYADTDLQNFKALITQKLDTAKKEASSLKLRLDDLERQADSEGGHSYGEDGKNQENREFTTRMYERLAEEIHDLELALARIANKTYGIDQDTGELIDKDRLLAMPTATKAL